MGLRLSRGGGSRRPAWLHGGRASGLHGPRSQVQPWRWKGRPGSGHLPGCPAGSFPLSLSRSSGATTEVLPPGCPPGPWVMPVWAQPPAAQPSASLRVHWVAFLGTSQSCPGRGSPTCWFLYVGGEDVPRGPLCWDRAACGPLRPGLGICVSRLCGHSKGGPRGCGP